MERAGTRGLGRARRVAVLGALLYAAYPASAQVLVGEISKPGLQIKAVALYEAGNKLFAFDEATKTILVVHAATLQELGSIPVPFESVYSMVVDESRGKLYVGCWCPGAGPKDFVAVIDAVSGTLLRYLTSSGYTQLVKDEALDAMYMSYNGGVSRIDVVTDMLTLITGIAGNLFTSMSVNPVTHELFVSNWSQNDDAFYVVDGTTFAVSTVPNLAGFSIGVNWIENKAYISYCKSAGFEGFCIYDRKTGAIKRFYASNDASNKPAFNPKTNRIHSPVEVNRVTSIIEGASDAWFNVPMPESGTAVGVRYATGNVYYVLPGKLSVMDGASAKIVKQFPGLPLQGSLSGEAIAINQGAGLVYMMNRGGVTVVQDPSPPSPLATIDDRTISEGSAQNAAFRISLASPSVDTVTVDYATVDDTAKAGLDYSFTSGTLTFTPGRTQHSIVVPIVTDTVAEGNETFFVNLINPQNATLGTKSQGVGTIQDPPAMTKSAMYRSYNRSTDYHFFTTDLSSKNFAVGTLGFQDESTPIPFYVWNSQQSGTVPLFRMYNPNLGRHFYTASSGSRDFIMSIGGVYEKEEGFVFPLSTSPVPSGATELFLLYNNNSGTHLFTADAGQKNAILSIFPGVWVQHTSVGFVFTSP